MPRKRLSTDYSFANVPGPEIQRSSFDRSHGHKTTFDAGLLIPIFVDEALPGDTFNVNMSGFGRLATPIHPVMDNMVMETFFFAVPNRLVWDNWHKFNGEQDNPGDSTDYLVPQILADPGLNPGTIYDYMGIPPDTPFSISAFPLRAYNLIYNEWFRDQNLQDSLTVDKTDGPDQTIYELKRRGKRHDYFTSCLPWPQKGEEVLLPIGDKAPLRTDAINASGLGLVNADNDGPHVLDSSGSQLLVGANLGGFEIYADLTSSTAATINDLREAFQIQKLYERDARGGTRYTEIIQSHFGVTSDDARLQRPEYLGGGKTPVIVSEVAQTSESDISGPDSSPQGNLAATGRVQFNGHGFTKSFTEHCTLIGLVCVRADLTYQQGINRMWSRQGRFDFYWPALSHLGEQAVLGKEIFADGTEDDDSVFGYQERYAEYRYKPSQISGLFRSQHPQSLDVWHLAQDFATRPVLDSDFITENPPVDRVIAVQDEPHFIFDSWFKMTTARPMPTYAVPGMIDHF